MNTIINQHKSGAYNHIYLQSGFNIDDSKKRMFKLQHDIQK